MVETAKKKSLILTRVGLWGQRRLSSVEFYIYAGSDIPEFFKILVVFLNV